MKEFGITPGDLYECFNAKVGRESAPLAMASELIELNRQLDLARRDISVGYVRRRGELALADPLANADDGTTDDWIATGKDSNVIP